MMLRKSVSSYLWLFVIVVEICSEICEVRGIQILEGPSDFIVIPPSTEAVFSCNLTEGGLPSWRINGSLFVRSAVYPAGHVLDGIYLNISIPVNGTEYICVLIFLNGTTTESDPAFLFIAGVPAMVPAVSVDTGSITVIGNSISLTVIWREPFNNFDPITSYTVSCTSTIGCPADFMTTDNAMMSHTFTGLITRKDYTFSVVATNSLGTGPAGKVIIITPSVPSQVMGVTLMCDPVGLNNECTADWQPVSVTGGPFAIPLIYQVYHNGTTEIVISPTTMLTFIAPSLSRMFHGSITVIVIAVNKIGSGPTSDLATQQIMGPSVTNAEFLLVPSNSSNVHSITVTCTINPESTAEQCEVMAIPTSGGANLSDLADISNGMATVTFNNLVCEVIYTITAGGLLNGNLVGPRSSHGTIMSGPCPSSLSKSCDDNIGAIIGAAVGGIFATIVVDLITIVLVYFCYYQKKKKKTLPVSSNPTYEMMQSPVPDNAQRHTYSRGAVSMEDNPAYQTGGGRDSTGQNLELTVNPSYAVP